MLIDLTKKREEIPYSTWCCNLFKNVINYGSTDDKTHSISIQQRMLLTSLEESKYNIIKAYRCAGVSTIMYLHTIYNMLFSNKDDLYKELYIYDSNNAAKYAMERFLNIIDICKEQVYLIAKTSKTLKFRFENKESLVRFISQGDSDKDIFEPYDTINIDNAAWIQNERIIHDLPDSVQRFKSRVNIASTPQAENGFFYDIWDMTIKGKGHFKPVSLKWYLDNRYNKELLATSGLDGYKVDNIGMICEALEHGDMLTNKWYEEQKTIRGDMYISEIDGDFMDRWSKF